MTNSDLESLLFAARDKLANGAKQMPWREIAELANIAIKVDAAIGACYRLDSIVNPQPNRERKPNLNR